MDENYTLSFCGVKVFDFDSADVVNVHWQYNNVIFHLEELKYYNGEIVEVYEDWKLVIWGDSGVKLRELYIMENDDFKSKLFERYPLKEKS